MKASEYFNEIHFTECSLSIDLVSPEEVIIEAEHLEISEAHPLFSLTGKVVDRCRMKFYSVYSSKREIFEYRKDRYTNDFKEKKVVSDMEEKIPENEANTYEFEGVLDEPVAWVEWTIKASRFELELLT